MAVRQSTLKRVAILASAFRLPPTTWWLTSLPGGTDVDSPAVSPPLLVTTLLLEGTSDASGGRDGAADAPPRRTLAGRNRAIPSST